MAAIPLAARCRIQGSAYKRAAKREAREASEETPYGPFVDAVEVECTEGAQPSTVHFIRPAALLWKTTENSARFMALLRSCGLSHDAEAQPTGQICIYLDDVVPGNSLRADGGRKYVAVYWALLNLPQWFLASQHGWFPLCMLPRKVYKKLRGGMSQLCAVLLRQFFEPGAGNFTDGIMLTHAAQPVVLLKCKFLCWLADADAFPAISGCKTTSGTHPCGCCRFIVGRCTPAEIPVGSAMVHYTCSDVGRWGCWASADLLDLHRHLALQWAEVQAGRLEPTAFQTLQQEVGYNYLAHGILGSDMAIHADLPESVFYDWMHTLVSSGGVAQYEVNQLLRRLFAGRSKENKQLLWAKLQQFQGQIVFPKGEPRKQIDLEQRYVAKPDKHVRMFAAEVLKAVVVLGAFCEAVLKPAGALKKEIECFELLVRILYLLRAGPHAVRCVVLLNQLVHEHHKQFCKLYPGSAKIKVHILLHIPMLIARFGCNLSCFVTERKHRESKQIGAFAFKNWTLTMLRRCLLQHLDRSQESEFAAPFYLCGAKPIDWGVVLQRSYGLSLHGRPEGFQRQGRSLKTTVGEVHLQDLVLVVRDGGIAAGFAQDFFESADGTCWCGLSFLYPLGGNIFGTELGRRTDAIVLADRIAMRVPYMQEDGRLCALCSNDVMSQLVREAQPALGDA